MSVPQLLPGRDLLDQVEGVETGLRRGRNARLVGVVLAAIQVTVLVANSAWVAALLSADWEAVLDKWPLLVSLFLLVLAVVMAGWTRFWLRESKQPFRYTYSVAAFEPVPGDKEQSLLVPMHTDLRERLSSRIRRLSRLDEYKEDASPQVREGAEAARTESHVHISGEYALRKRPPDSRWFVEVTCWVQVGGPARPATLAVPVKFALTGYADERDGDRGDLDDPPALSREHYEDIVERTYFSIATAVYRQIKEDVARKVDLLPNRWFRASALFYEAQDYADSNTLDAYDHAAGLYAAALGIYDPASIPLPETGVRRIGGYLGLLARSGIATARRWASRLVPRLGRSEVLTARAQVGYANALLDTGILASLAGLQASAAYEARPTALRAVRRLETLKADVPGKDDSLFDARVAVAFAHARLAAFEAGREALAEAGARQPTRMNRDPRYLFVQALLEDRLISRIQLYQRVVELAPRFEAAQFELAETAELLWRSRETLEINVAESIFQQYDEVLKLNPGNIAASANAGYMHWLLEDKIAARKRFSAGLRVKEIKRQAYVAELDHGLARIAAERGRFEEAYQLYIRTVSAVVSQGWARGSYEGYHFDRMSWAMLCRFRRYREAVERHWRQPSPEEGERTTDRVRASVYAFVLWDFSQACLSYYLRTYDYAVLEEGHRRCLEAVELNEDFVLPAYLRIALEREMTPFGLRPEPADRQLERIERLAPGWPEADMERLRTYDKEAKRLREKAIEARDDAEARADEAADLRRRLLASPGPRDFAPGTQPEHGASIELDDLRAREQEAAEHEDAADDLDARAEHLEREAKALPKKLLPHEWLWKRKRDELNWRAVRSRAIERELRWERSFEEFHVNALFAYCTFLSNQPDVVGRLDELLELIERRFWPSAFNLVELREGRAAAGLARPVHGRWRRRLPPPSQAECRRRMTRIAESQLARDDSMYMWLTWLPEDRDATYERFMEVAERKGQSPYLYLWLGQRLTTRLSEQADKKLRQCALHVLDLATKIEQPDALVELAQTFAALGESGPSEELYDRAAAHPDAGLDVTRRVALHLDEADQFDRMLDLYGRAKELDSSSNVPWYEAQIGRAQFALGRYDEARSTLDGIAELESAPGPEWRSELAQSLARAQHLEVGNTRTHLRDWLLAAQRAAIRKSDEDAAADAGGAALALPAPRGGTAVMRTPCELPGAIEAHESFFPQADDTPGVQRMIEAEIPAARRRIEEDTGVEIPGVRIGPSPDLPPRGYRVLLHGVVVDHGVVPASEQDPHAWMVGRVEMAARRHLLSFIDTDSVEAMLERWISRDPAERRPRANARLGSVSRRTSFTRFLKLLVADGIAVDDLSVAVEVFPSKGEPKLERLVSEVRERSREHLTGRAYRAVRLPKELETRIEQYVSDDVSSSDVRIPEPELGEIRRALTRLDESGESHAFVVSSARLRPFVRQIVALDAAEVPVLTRDEALSALRRLSSL